jgi:hypothetical protein
MEHKLKCWPQFYQDIFDDVKQFELRLDDRKYAVGDRIELKEFNPYTNKFTRREMVLFITYILKDFPGIEKGYVIFGFKIVDKGGSQ